jgi:hypothetical protein
MWKIYAPDVCLSRDLPQESVRYQRQLPTSEENTIVSGTQRLEFAEQQTIETQDSELPTISHQQETNTCPQNRFLRLSVTSKP